MESPRLPPELECGIFMTAFQADFNDVKNLALVAKRVHDWILPKAVEVVILSSQRKFPMVFDLEKFEKYGPHVRSLFITQTGLGENADEHLVIKYIALCPNLTNLALWCFASPHLSDSLAILPLTRLWINLQLLLSDPPSPKLLKLFANITHLRVIDSPFPLGTSDGDSLSLRGLFPSLTHISFLFTQADLRLKVLSGWDKLRVVVVWEPDEAIFLSDEIYVEIRSDIRPLSVAIVCDTISGWEDGARDRGPDIWEFAERVIQSRPAQH
ncbi:hypothetical protein BDN72DRAFT_902610 [Pluteus cervinus]|uniref:Uncharacterized protein n=1 Tax=Pluteus cervinus TaxID=181527 RepID=A0ACD3ABD9_9AGAR|nr:hypothetical protein BDN72DRAFT_902610 [Pluteus cervinus]